MKVRKLKLLNFRGIEALSMDFTQPTTAFVGINGVGKSTVLDALAIALSQLTWRLNGHPQKARPIAIDDIRIGSDFARIEIVVDLYGKPITWAIVTNRKKGIYSDLGRKSNFEELNNRIGQMGAILEDNTPMDPGGANFPLSVYYDVNRSVLDVPMRVREKLEHNPYEIYRDSLDHGGADFKRFFIWFRNFEDSENERRTDDPSFRDTGLQAARSAITTFTGFSDLRVRRKPSMRMTVNKNGVELNVLQLSDGERNMLALVGDMARRLSVLNSGLANPNEGFGVVLIDEIDLHLHPGWQREVVPKLEKTFPNCQFIISTHSAQVVGELPPSSIKRLREGRLLGQPSRSIGLSSGEILEELMNARARNADFEGKIQNIECQIELENYAGARSALEKLRQEFGDLPEGLRLEETLEWLDPTKT
jgi:predicted ATP-binding protein involved in virulence